MARTTRSLCLALGGVGSVSADNRTFCGIGGQIPAVNDQVWREFQPHMNHYWNWGLEPKPNDTQLPGLLFTPTLWGPDEPDSLFKVAPAGRDANGTTYSKTFYMWNEMDMIGGCNGKVTTMQSWGPATSDDDGCWHRDNSSVPCVCMEPTSAGYYWNNQSNITGTPVYNEHPDLVTPSKLREQLEGKFWLETLKPELDAAMEAGYELTSPMIAHDLGKASDYESAWLPAYLDILCNSTRRGTIGKEGGHYCPKFLNFHFYAFILQPEDGQDPSCNTNVEGFEAKVQDAVELIDTYDAIDGFEVTELGVLAYFSGTHNATTGQPLKADTDLCTHNDIVGIMNEYFNVLNNPNYSKYARAVNWFSQPAGVGGSFDLRLFDEGNKSSTWLGEKYLANCMNHTTNVADDERLRI